MPEDMPPDEQVRRVSLALDYSAATVGALTTLNHWSGQRVAALTFKLAGAVGAQKLGDYLASGILLRAAHGARLVGGNYALGSSALIPMMMRVAKRVGEERTMEALRALVARRGSAPTAPSAPTTGDASSSATAPVASGSNQWQCISCNAVNSNGDPVCIATVHGRRCNSPQATGLPVGGTDNKRRRTEPQRYASGPSAAPPPRPRSGGADGGANNAPARGKRSVAEVAPALPTPAAPLPLSEDAPRTLAGARHALSAALAELDEMVGVSGAKVAVTEQGSSVIRGLMRRELTGEEPQPACNHMLFVGNPGTGKTTVARIVAKLFYRMGVVPSQRVCEHENARTAMVAEHVGCTDRKAMNVIKKAIGGVLFLDEVRPSAALRERTFTCTCMSTRHSHLHRLTRSLRREAATTTRERPSMCSCNKHCCTVTTRSSSSRGIATESTNFWNATRG